MLLLLRVWLPERGATEEEIEKGVLVAVGKIEVLFDETG